MINNTLPWPTMGTMARSSCGKTNVIGSDFDIFAQRISQNGVPLWTTDGITLCAASGDQDAASIVSDGQGGAIIVWEDHRSGSQWDVYAQRVNADGAAMWAANGAKVTDILVGNRMALPVVASDGAKGALIAWMNRSSGARLQCPGAAPLVEWHSSMGHWRD